MSSREPDLVGQPLRCRCNKLLLTLKDDVVIIKCGRCKKYMVIQTAGILAASVYDAGAAELRCYLERTAGEDGHTGTQ